MVKVRLDGGIDMRAFFFSILLLVLAGFAGATAETAVKDGIAYRGEDMPSRNFPGQNAAYCQRSCDIDSACMAWTYIKPGQWGFPTGHCFLKDGVPREEPNPCCVSGRKLEVLTPGMLQDTDQFGSDIGPAATLPRPDPMLCSEMCSRNPSCQGWTYTKPGVYNPKPQCYLKSPLPVNRNTAAPCCISGFWPDRFGENATRRVPKPYSAASGGAPASDAAICRNRCEQDPSCNTWTFDAGNGPGQGQCFASTSNLPPVNDNCCVSARKTGVAAPVANAPPPAIKGYEVVLRTVGVASNRFGAVTFTCPGTKIALGGGLSMRTTFGRSVTFFTEFKGVMVNGQSVTYRVRNTSFGELFAYAATLICADPIPGLIQRDNTTVTASGASAMCLPNETLVGGGFDTANDQYPNFGHPISATFFSGAIGGSATGGGYGFTMQVPGNPAKMTARALCAPGQGAFGAHIAVGSGIVVPGNQAMRTDMATCTGGSQFKPTAGGSIALGPGVAALFPESMAVPPSSWRIEVANRDIFPGNTVGATALAVCARADP